MEIRRVTLEEYIHYYAICETCFLSGERRDIRAQLREPTATVDEPDFGGRKNQPVWGAFENGVLLSAMTINDFTMRMNGQEVRMGGIGAVVTRPEARGRGLVRRIMRPVFDEMRDAGQVYSFLYPFSFDYYRKFGYELCLSYNTATIPIGEFAGFAYPQNFAAHEPEDSHEPFAQIYDEFARERNLSIIRNADNWKWLLNRDPYLKTQFTFLNRDTHGTPDAYVLYDTDRTTGESYIKVRELCWATPEGLRAVFGFFGRLSPEYRGVTWNVPNDLNIQALMPNPYAAKWEVKPTGMNRIVDVPSVLAMHPAPEGTGRVTIGVSDAFCPDNTGLYHIEWEENRLTVTRKAEDFTTADMETNVTTLAQLITGYSSPAQARYRADTAVRANAHALARLFPPKSLYSFERF